MLRLLVRISGILRAQVGMQWYVTINHIVYICITVCNSPNKYYKALKIPEW